MEPAGDSVPGLQLLTCSNTTDHSRLAYVEALNNETAITLCEFFERARLWFRSVDVAVDEILTDNGANFKSKKFADQLAHQTITHTFTKPYQPQTNTKHQTVQPYPHKRIPIKLQTQNDNPTTNIDTKHEHTTTTPTNTTPPPTTHPHHA